MKRVIQYVLISLMFVIPLAGFLTTDPNYIVKNENRTITKFPKFGSDAYFSDLVKWYTDRLLYKIKASENYYNEFSSVLANDGFLPSGLSVRGLDNWFFIGDSANQAYSQHTRDVVFNKKVVAKKLEFLHALKESCDNTPFYLVVGPNKHGIYTEYMKDYVYNPGKFRAFDKYKSQLNDYGISYIDNRDALLDAKKTLSDNVTLYFSSDTHWNLLGAHVAFENVMKQVISDFSPNKYEFTFEHSKKGDLVTNITPPKHKFLDVAFVKDSSNTYITVEEISENTIKDTVLDLNSQSNYPKRYTNLKAKDKRKVIIMSDSFGAKFVPFAVDYFKTVIHLPRTNTDDIDLVDFIRKEKADLVLYINVERKVFAN